jgi:hypothetical protein
MPAVAPEGGIPAPVAPAPPDALAEELPKPILPPKPAGVRFLGSPAQRTAAKEKDEALAYAATLPAGPQRQAVEYYIKTGKAAPAGMFKTGEDNQPIARVDSKRQVVQRLENGVWTDVTGDVPKGTHFIQEPTPASTTGSDNQKENMRISAYNRADTELNKKGAPFEDQMKNLELAEAAVNDRTPTGDAHVAPMVLKALVAGQGSGFRMTKSEIDEVKNARSKWDSMAAAFRKWDSGDKASLFFGDAQRSEFLHLIETVRKVTTRHLEPINQTRRKILSAKSVDEIHGHMADMHDPQAPKDDDKAAEPKRVRYDISGKVVK